MRKVVCLGGGNAMPKAVLAQIKNEKIDLSVISATLDSGGSSGKLRRDFNIIAVGDMRRAFLELSPLRRSWKNFNRCKFTSVFNSVWKACAFGRF